MPLLLVALAAQRADHAQHVVVLGVHRAGVQACRDELLLDQRVEVLLTQLRVLLVHLGLVLAELHDLAPRVARVLNLLVRVVRTVFTLLAERHAVDFLLGRPLGPIAELVDRAAALLAANREATQRHAGRSLGDRMREARMEITRRSDEGGTHGYHSEIG